jgi:FkbM family methyltransferase
LGHPQFGLRGVVENAALSNTVGSSTFTFARGTPEENGLRQRTYNMPEKADPIEIEVRVDSIDNYARNLSKLTFVKIDVEGGEGRRERARAGLFDCIA